MTNIDLEELKKTLGDLVKIVGSATALLTALSALFKKMWPFLKFVVASSTLLLPYGLAIWIFLFWVAENFSTFTIPIVFVQTLLFSTITISVYAAVWCIGIYPRLYRWLFTKEKNEEHRNLTNDNDDEGISNEQGDVPQEPDQDGS